MSRPSCLASVSSISARKRTASQLMDDSPREEACPFHIPKTCHFCPQAAPWTMPQKHKPGSGSEKMSALPLSLQWVSPRHHHSWQLFTQPAVEDGWCWRLPHSLNNLCQGFTTGNLFSPQCLSISVISVSLCPLVLSSAACKFFEAVNSVLICIQVVTSLFLECQSSLPESSSGLLLYSFLDAAWWCT